MHKQSFDDRGTCLDFSAKTRPVELRGDGSTCE